MKRLVLAGGGHAHVEVLRDLAERPGSGIAVTVVSPRPRLVFTGMIPGAIAGHYRLEDCAIDVEALARRANARFVNGAIFRVDAAKHRVHCADGETIDYDILSLDVGSRVAVGPATGVRYPSQLRDRPELRLDGARLVDTGAIDSRHTEVFGVEGAFMAGPAMIEGEWFRYKIDRRFITATTLPDPHFTGWYVMGSWVLTGESRVYNPVEARFDAPRLNYSFNPEAGTWGAFELAARYSDLDLNYHEGAPGTTPAAALGAIRGGEQKIYTLGVNWYLNPSMRLMLDYQHVKIDRLGATGLQVGQTYDALAARGQVNF